MAALAVMAPRAQQSPPQTFRGSVDLIAVDVQVIDREGRPVADLGPEKFEVTINGRKRRVISADLIRAGAASPSPLIPLAAAAAANASAPVTPPGRIVILAVDCLSFDAAAARGAMVAARTFIERLPADDLVGLFAYPLGPKIDPTIDRAAVVRALDAIAGQSGIGNEGEFHLRPAEIVDLAAWADNLPGNGEDLAVKACGADLNDDSVQECRGRLRTTVKATALAYEGQGYAGLSMLRSLMHGLAGVTGRKTMVLVSAGTIASDVPGGRPDLTDIGVQVGKAAAEANVAVYTLFIDQGWLQQYSAETRRPTLGPMNNARDSATAGHWLEMFSGSAGGSLLKVLVGNGEYAYDRLLTEMSAYYLLGVEPDEADRDGRPRAMKVKVAQKDATVRGRSWVVVPKRNANATIAPKGSDAASPAASPGPVTAAPARPLPEPVRTIASAFERNDYAVMHQGLAAAPDLANVIGDFRAGDSPWPAAPRRTAVFALELALAGLSSRNGFARDQGIRLLAEYLSLVRQPVPDSFECTWYWAAVAGLEGLRLSDTALVLVTRAAQRCPAEPRFPLARATITDLREGEARAADTLLLYDAAMKFPETESEARVRAAWLCYRTGQIDRAVELVGKSPAPSSDLHVRYVYDLVKGRVLRARGQTDASAEAFRAALALVPGAQSARVALMTLLLGRGDRQEAERLAEEVQIAPDSLDPWATFDVGDFRFYPAILAELRSLGR